MAGTRQQRDPYVWEALVSLFSLVAGISISIAVYGMDPHIPMLLGVFVAAVVGYKAGFSWDAIQAGMLKGISNSLQAIVILFIIGILIGVWILSGVVPTLLFYGLKILNPTIFLVATVLICAVTSLATGTSWGTTGTIGVALMGIGAGLGFPLPVVAGAVLSGAYFGDKMSPLSDTTNLAPAMVGTDLYTHIRHMTYTSGVAFGLTLVIEIVLGFAYGGGEGNVETVNLILETAADLIDEVGEDEGVTVGEAVGVGALDQAGRGLAEHATGLAARVPQDLATRRVGGAEMHRLRVEGVRAGRRR